MLVITIGYAILWGVGFILLYNLVKKQRNLTAQINQLEQSIQQPDHKQAS
jgi:hypothetical protein